MQTRYMERTKSMKRSLEGDEEQQPERKRPALASVIVEALKVDSLQRLCSSLEPILRRVVSEEVERALAKLGPARVAGRSSPKRIEGSDGRNLQLQFRSRLSLPLFTGGKVEGEHGAAIHVVLIDADTGHLVTTGAESCIKLDVVVLEGDFNTEDDEGWTQEEFDSHVVKEREGKRPLLTGELQVTLKEGVGTLGDLTFTDNSSWIRSRKFRLGMKVASGYCEGVRIREAKTEAFTVKDHRGELYKKHYPPALNDDVWRLEKIGKDGSFHKRLNKAEIFTVEDFLRLVVRDPQKLRNILGSGMSNKMWDALIEHAKTCVLSGKLYVYYSDDSRNVGVVFNNIYELNGLIAGEQYYSADSLSDSQKVYVDSLVKKAYDNWNQVVEYDGKSFLNIKQNQKASSSRNELAVGPVDYPNNVVNQLPQSRLPVSVQSEQSAMDPNLLIGVSGYNDSMVARMPNQSPMMNSNSRSQFESTPFAPQQQITNTHQLQSTSYDNNVGLALGPPQSSSFQTMTSSLPQTNLNPFEDWSHNRDKGVDEFLSEEEIRMRSHEILENDDMQHLLRLFSMGGGHGSVNVSEDGYGFPSFMPSPSPTFGYDEDPKRSGKAVVGWLKIKAAMRWGFFVRKKAAERRAQIVELDDE
ncbi:calmodulin-binding protein 60 B [Nicotiana tomentosiformis]|uniref:calmodulin-binding protein 60 B n=1 Tax=Nicotiana tomentosiformis TaxID=4098 RepID=UPI00087911EC|nr:calmodulin-binding protein 60 B-like [Nicotiana tomentosiformis]XP_018630110.1 calmodulin-binding protein 60 B-like [Nicotiana tomentosiformis]